MTASELRAVLARAIGELQPAELPALIGVLAEAQAIATARLTVPRPALVAAADELVDAEALAGEFGVPATWFREQARKGALPYRKLGRYVRFNRDDVRAALADHRMETPASAEKPSNGVGVLPRRYQRRGHETAPEATRG